MQLELQMLGLKSRLYDKMLRKLSRNGMEPSTKNQETSETDYLIESLQGLIAKGHEG